MPRKQSPNCPKCGQPRYVSVRGGKMQPFCHEHMKEYWRDHNRGVNSKLRYPNGSASLTINDGESATAAASPSVPFRVVHSKNGAGGCAMCHRTPKQAAIFALCARVWCSACTPESTSHADLLNRLVPVAPIPVTEGGLEGSGLPVPSVASGDDEEALRGQLQEALRELRVLREAVNAPLTAWEHYT